METPNSKPIDSRMQTSCLMILTAIAIASALYWLRSVMVPFVLAAFLAFAMKPLVEFQARRLRFPRPLAVTGTLLLTLALLIIIGSIVSASVMRLAYNADKYTAQAQQLIDWAAERIPLEKLGLTKSQPVEPPSTPTQTPYPPAARPSRFDSPIPDLPPLLITPPKPEPTTQPTAHPSLQALSQQSLGFLQSMLVGTAGALQEILSSGLLVLIFVLFLLLGEPAGLEPADSVWGQATAQIRRYIVTKFTLSAATGLSVGVILILLGVDMAVAFGFFAFLLNFIPSIGSIIATLLPLPIVLVSPELSTAAKIMAFAIPGTIQFAIGNVIEPRIMGRSLDLHPVTILLALIFWGMLWGIVGMFLATPITALVKIILTRLPYTESIADLLAGRIHHTAPIRTKPSS